jgi:hypothetical protein
MTRRKRQAPAGNWYAVDLHLHTPASADYQEPSVKYLDILRTAAARGLHIVALTDHNTVAGYRRMQDELAELEMLEKLGRLRDEEKSRLREFRELRSKVLVLPGFEFTATFGFHILGVFPPETPLRELELLLLQLNIPANELDAGSVTVGVSADVLTCYRTIYQAGGLAIAAHANSSNGVAMRGFPIGGQTKIAYTQDPNLHALEVTDLEQRGRRSTAGFFSGIKPEYPRRMHCIQGSDAHRLRRDPQNAKQLGIGDRATEMLLPEPTFQAIRELFASQDFARTRPHKPRGDQTFDFISQTREDGPSIVQAFHESVTARGGKLYAIIADVCALANTNGGTVLVGLSGDPKQPPKGVPNARDARGRLEREIRQRISPPLKCQVDLQETGGVTILRVLVPRGDDAPYAVDDNKIYVREEAETGLAVRDEIVAMVLRRREAAEAAELAPETPRTREPAREARGATSPPRTGVEIVAVEERDGVRYYTMRDLRNGNVVKNVTRSSARRLWHYAIEQRQALPEDLEQLSASWQGDLAVLRKRGAGKTARYDLAQRGNGAIRLYFGVTDDGVHGPWRELVGGEGE